MPIEYEAKVLDIDPEAIEARILFCGGQKTANSTLLRRNIYPITPPVPDRWLRLRDNGRGATLAYKDVVDDSIGGTHEIEVGVSDFETMSELLAKAGLVAVSYQENRRTSYTLDGASLEIDQWPLIPAYLEIEGEDKGHVLRVAEALGFTESDLTGENTMTVYRRHGIDLAAIAELRFRPEDQ